jgi:CRISPR/Cas system-associated endonuclease Cas1
VKAGLDPYFGLIHGSKRDQGSLVFDLIEEFRAPFSDRLVIGMLGRGFQPEIRTHRFLKTRTRRMLAIAFSKQWSKKMAWRSHEMAPAQILEK